MSIINKIRKIRSAIRYGGYNEIKICQLKNDNCLKGKRILITGGSSGIGFQIAKKCCSCGANVIITGRNEEKLINSINNINGEINYLVWDLMDTEHIEEHLNRVLHIFKGSLDCLINNAGVEPHEFFPDVTEKEWANIYDTNSKGAFFLTQEVYKHWLNHKESDYKKIIFIDSQGGFVGATYPYRMVKWDIRGLTKGLGLKLAKDGILVNGIAPGVVKTEMQKFSLEQGDNTYCDQNLLGRVCLPEEVAEMAAFMLSDACNFMVGQTILIDGGYSLK